MDNNLKELSLVFSISNDQNPIISRIENTFSNGMKLGHILLVLEKLKFKKKTPTILRLILNLFQSASSFKKIGTLFGIPLSKSLGYAQKNEYIPINDFYTILAILLSKELIRLETGNSGQPTLKITELFKKILLQNKTFLEKDSKIKLQILEKLMYNWTSGNFFDFAKRYLKEII